MDELSDYRLTVKKENGEVYEYVVNDQPNEDRAREWFLWYADADAGDVVVKVEEW